ncbi:MAG: membrane protein insertase YidC [Crocinitomicaceae bacterium]|nr:membrane protein insertase YidC [Crocinitomicaceae bacterium]
MDKKTVIGLVLIGTIFSVFTIFNQPSAEERAKMEEEYKKEQLLQKEKQKLAESTKSSNEKDSEKIVDTVKVEPVVKKENTATDSLIFLENSKYKIAFNTKGGIIASLWLKEFETYANFAKKDGKITALELFKNGDAVNQLVFDMDGKKIKTGNLPFSVVAKTKNSIVFETEVAPGKTIQNQYILTDDAYDLNYTIHMKGFGSSVNAKNVGLNWDMAYRKTERLFVEQRRVSTVCMFYNKEGFDYLKEITDDNDEAKDKVDWVAYKQSYFSSILKPERPFLQKGTDFEVQTYKEDHPRAWTNLKDYSSTLMLDISNPDNASISLDWYFGPNDFNILTNYDKDYNKIINYGWGLFRWINVYVIAPIYNTLTGNMAISAGIAILILTLIIKLILMPVQWKMYVSSAKMRILKPEIEALNKKYPNKEDGMKKQMEMMTLYRESGASPLSGCVPMLFQAPILFAIFRYFPAEFSLRQESFLWAEDLSSYDSIWDFGVNIWFYGDHMSLFTLLMAGTTLIYTMINSGNMQAPQQPGMPNMKVIMYFMPIMMIFFFNNYSSGLSYYYFISTLASILIMIAIKKFFVDEEKLKAKMAEKKATAAAGGGKKKSKFQERLEMMQKMQQEQMKNKNKK